MPSDWLPHGEHVTDELSLRILQSSREREAEEEERKINKLHRTSAAAPALDRLCGVEVGDVMDARWHWQILPPLLLNSFNYLPPVSAPVDIPQWHPV